MKQVFGAMVALACVALLSGCSLLSDFPSPSNDDSDQKDDVVMQHIANAVKHHDVAALKKVFSPAARANAKDLEGGLKYFLSFFPAGRMTWDVGGAGASGGGLNEAPNFSWLASANYKVYSGAKTYDVYLANVTLDSPHPKYLGVYALGISPYSTNPAEPNGATKPFYLWTGQFGMSGYTPSGTPGVYRPGMPGTTIQHVAPTPSVEMQRIVDAVKHHDAAALKSLFSPAARAKAANLDSGLKYFLSVLPSTELTWTLAGSPGGGSRGGYTTEYDQWNTSYTVSAGAKKFILYFSEFAVDQPDTDYVGIYSLGVAPYAANPGKAPAPPTQFSAWTKSFKTDFDGNVSAAPGVYVPQN